MGKTITKLVSNNKPPERETPEVRLQMLLDYCGQSSMTFKHKIVNLLKEYYPNEDTRVFFRSGLTLKSMLSHKERIPDELQSGVVYKYLCRSCNASYVGRTGRQLRVRIAEHRGVSFRTGQRISNPSFSAIREHLDKCDSHITPSNFSILHKANNFDLPILENLNINSLTPSLCIQEGSGSTLCF